MKYLALLLVLLLTACTYSDETIRQAQAVTPPLETTQAAIKYSMTVPDMQMILVTNPEQSIAEQTEFATHEWRAKVHSFSAASEHPSGYEITWFRGKRCATYTCSIIIERDGTVPRQPICNVTTCD